MKLGSLFDGSGGFPLAGSRCGIEPVWASEVEPYPIAVTRSRFPNMKHLGSVTDINGGEIEPVDVITFGSPCQDLSVAGKRAGLKHEANGDEETTRSGLFMEAVRIIKEMREATNGRYPAFALWENVPGAFSSNKGEDFRIVLEELIKIVEPGAVMPAVPKNGWPYADRYCGDGWSIAYRVFDAQLWGVPQRRRRIYLVLDLRGERAGEILFERKGLRGYFAESWTPGQGTAGNAENRAGADDPAGNGVTLFQPVCYNGENITSSRNKANPQPGDPCHTLGTDSRNYLVMAAGFKAGNGAKANGIGWEQEKSPTLSAAPSGTNQAPSVCIKTWDVRGNGDGDTVNTITGDHENRITDYTSVVVKETPVYCLQGNGINRADTAGCNGRGWTENVSYTLNTIDRPAVCYADTYQKVTGPLMANSHPGSYSGQDAYTDMLVVGKEKPIVFDKEVYNSGANATGAHYIAEGGPAPSLRTMHPPGVCIRHIVRRLTPTECARLQGFPDLWGHPDPKTDFTDEEYRFWMNVRNIHAAINGKVVKDYTKAQMLTWYNKLHVDSAEYKMWGNGIALPTALYVMQGIEDALKGGK